MNNIIYIALKKSSFDSANSSEPSYDIIRASEHNKLEACDYGIKHHVGKSTTLYPWHRVLEVYSR